MTQFLQVSLQILARHMDASKWLSYGLTSAKLLAAVSWSLGVGVTVLHDNFQFDRASRIVKNVMVLCVVISTGLMNLYVWFTLRALRNEADSSYRAAVTALLLFFNFMVFYAYVTAVNIYSIYAIEEG